MKKLIIILCGLCLAACTDNQRARNFGGTETVDLPAGKKLMSVTWKDSELWYLYRPMRPGEAPEQLVFEEKSSVGIVEGKVIFNEKGR